MRRHLTSRHDRLSPVVMVPLVFALLAGGGSAHAADEAIKIGTVNDVSGVSATTGRQQVNGQRLAVAEANAAGGVLGRQIEMQLADGKCNATDAVSATNSLVNDGIVAMMGPLCSVACTAAMPILKRAKVASITAGCASQDVAAQSGKGGNEWFFILPPPESDLARVGGKVLSEKLGYKSASLLGRDDGFGRGVVEGFEENLPEVGIEVKSSDLYKPGDSDFRSVLTKMNGQDPDVFVMAAQIDEAPVILQQYLQLGLDIPISGRLQVFSEEIYKAVGGPEKLNGFTFFSPWEAFADDEESQAFVKKYQDEFGETPLWQAYYGYVTTNVLLAAIEQAGSDDPELIRDAIENVDIDTPFGKVVWDDYHQFHPDVYVGIMEDGEPKILDIRSVD